jgi:hypothetical protein
MAALVAMACSATPVQQANPLRRELEQALAIATKQPLEVRWNPAPCPCPPFELRLGERWLRAELTAATVDPEAFATWLRWLNGTAPEALPVAVEVEGRVDNELVRAVQGGYAVRIEVSAVQMPAVPPSAPVPPVPSAPAPPSVP